MSYVDGFVAAVPNANKEAYLAHSRETSVIFKEFGATNVVECWGDDVPEGKLTSFSMAVKREPDETVVFSWIEWPSKAVRDDAWPKIMADPRMDPSGMVMPFDGKRMIYGGFAQVLNV